MQRHGDKQSSDGLCRSAVICLDYAAERSRRYGLLWHCPLASYLSIIAIIPLYCNCLLFICLSRHHVELPAGILTGSRHFTRFYQTEERHTCQWISATQNERYQGDFQSTNSHQERQQHMESLPNVAPHIIIRDVPGKVTRSSIFERKRRGAQKILQAEKEKNGTLWSLKDLGSGVRIHVRVA